MRRNSENHSNSSENRSSAVNPSKKERRGILRDFLTYFSTGGNSPASVKRGRLLLESLEQRQLMAGDVELMSTDGASDQTYSTLASQTGSIASQTGSSVSRAAEGELTDDLVAFAKALDEAGVIMYGAEWCPACTEQKELFEDGGKFLPFIEVTNPDRTPSQLAIDEGITSYPTWEFPDGTRLVGVQTLATLSARSGVAIPQGETPSFATIGNKTVQIGAPLHVPVDAYDPDGGPLTVTVSVANPDLLEAVVLSGNRSIRIDMDGYGDMVFELFEDRAPTASGRVITLAGQNFYDGIEFHRVIDNFVLQGGDPTATGTGGSTLGDFDDDFHEELMHTGSGILSYAKAGDDTNDSQFFITEGPQRFLDFNHSVFGQLVEGEKVREAISEHATDSSDKPTSAVRITSVDVFDDTENAVVMLKAKGNATGTTNVTYTVTDAQGRTYSETTTVSVIADTSNSQPFLNDVTDPAAVASGTNATLALSSVDVEGDAVTYFASSQNTAAATATVNPTTGVVTVTPAAGFVGTVPVLVGVRPGTGVTGNSSSDMDTQLVTFTFGSGESVATPTGIDLSSSSDTGTSTTDNITNAGTLSFVVSGVTSGATVELVNTATNTVVGVGAATGSTITITTNNIAALGDGTYNIAARQTVDGVTSERTAGINVVYDTEAPGSVADTAATQANVGREFRTDLISSEEGSGFTYTLKTAPAGATIVAATGEIVWTPTEAQIGDNTFTLELSDAAGNVRTESFNVNVAGQPIAEIKLTITDLDGNPITAVQVGQEFNLNMIGVDARTGDDLDGIFAAFADILFDSGLIQPKAGTAITFSDRFPTVQKGTISDGLIDELGAATDRLTPSELTDSLIATIRMEALGTGTVNIRSEPADAADSEVLLYGNDNRIPADAVAYGSVQLAIGQNFTVADDQVTVAEDSAPSTIDVLANDNVISGTGSLTLVSVTQPTSGAAVSVQNGKVAYLLDANFNGTFEFTYRVRDDQGIQEDATVTVTVTPVNDPPTATDDSFDVDQGSTSTPLDVLLNDLITPDTGETLRVTAVQGTTASGGTVTISANGQSVLYTPPANFTGSDSFTYTVSDGSLTDQATVSLLVKSADPPPTANGDAFTLTEDAAEAQFDVLNNDTADADNQAFTIISVGTADKGGAARVSDDGTQIFYKPAANFNGTETVTYTIRDTGGGIAVGTVTFTVTAVNDAPPIISQVAKQHNGTSEKSIFTLAELPANVDSSETLTFSNLSTPTAGGTVRIDAATGTIFYKPADGFKGTDTFTYQVNDGSGLTSTGTITVEVFDFVPRDVLLNFLSTDIDPSQIGGIVLTGTDDSNTAVEIPLSFTGDKPAFKDILPGTYKLQIPSLPFFDNGSAAQEITVTSLPEDGDMTVDISLGRLLPEFITIREWLGSTPKQSLLVAVEPGSENAVVVPSAAVKSISNPTVSLDSSSTNLTINGTKTTTSSTGTVTTSQVTATLPTTADRRVQTLGQSGGMQLYRVSVEEGDVTFAEQTTAAAATSTSESSDTGSTSAEGEFIDSSGNDSASLAATQTDATTMGVSSDDEDGVGQSLLRTQLASSSASANTEAVDDAMSQVASELTLISKTGDAIAEQDGTENSLSDQAIDAAIATDL
ncbi:peptidyl-prolyl cis-trans isomerase cyclophilin type [Rhodopirellula maiorica SM1]|uniref:peptidylprolyl isomerase n=1 Tax=Rhodopirellula maiorica SM1 TaxID=1265738 RepID=M5RQT4_9BACT|nr:tandem-95 repeat protein [Rhodopirellula maiorica]EMI21703.1 peptidyl-prolyl cis-trans isomerase cyclophilin type [Rhodopirellula maiorica SM1]